MPPRDQRIRELIEQRRQLVQSGTPDLTAGVAVFKKNCAICHRIGDEGAKIGHESRRRRNSRHRSPAGRHFRIPNRNVDQAFRTTQVVSTDGRILSGLALREEGKVLVLADAQGKEVRIAEDEIDQRVVNPLSLMPSNVPDLVNEQDFVHLLGYLLSQRVARLARNSRRDLGRRRRAQPRRRALSPLAGDGPLHGRAHVGGAFGDDDAGGFQGGDLFGGRALAAGDDRAGVAHALAGRGRAAGDEGGHRLGHVLL